jgi:hypothetical protein
MKEGPVPIDQGIVSFEKASFPAGRPEKRLCRQPVPAFFEGLNIVEPYEESVGQLKFPSKLSSDKAYQ